MGNSRGVTQADIAKRARVTPAVVSVVLSGSESATLSVSEETRSRVLEIAKELGYVARKTTGRKSGDTPKSQSVLLIEDSPTRETGELWVTHGYELLMEKIVSCIGEALNRQALGFSVHYLQRGRETN